ncbi:NmrA/HSCARG family protein [Actinoplanes solisilvae]|uniref:NmrA/HSCARG family protein n=1 Tax=Actinoplanes solisilvae TaxID=2486853 RepID=UPI000FDB04D2|nr:NmrA/HSCARG family protein [Actinoplanes solisilvae]
MSGKKVISVVGATGSQGGAVARALLDGGEFAVRAITRNASSEKAKALAELGAEVVEAELNDETSLREAFAGAYGAFMVTPFWEHMSAAKELVEIENLISAANAARLRHVVWSTLEDTREVIAIGDDRMPTLDEIYKVPHFDVKGGVADAMFEKSGLPTTYVRVAFYWDNLVTDLKPQRDADGTLGLHLPMGSTPIAGIASEDIGRAVATLFERPAESIGNVYGLAGEQLTGEQIADAFTQVLGEKVTYRPATHDEFRAYGFPGAVELGNMFQYYAEFPESYLGRRDVGLTRELSPNWLSLPAFLTRHRERI